MRTTITITLITMIGLINNNASYHKDIPIVFVLIMAVGLLMSILQDIDQLKNN